MTDLPETPDGAAEAPQSGATQQDRPSMPEGWTGEFDPHRAKATIDRLREFEPEAQQFRKLREDRAELERWLADEMGYELDTGEVADDDVLPNEQFQPDYAQDYGGEPDPLQEVMTRQERVEQWMIQQEARELASSVENHIDHLATEAKVELTDYERSQLFQAAVAVPGEISDRKTKQLFEGHVKWLKDREDAWQKRYLASKSAPEPAPAGQAGEPASDPQDAKARKQRIAARIQALQES